MNIISGWTLPIGAGCSTGRPRRCTHRSTPFVAARIYRYESRQIMARKLNRSVVALGSAAIIAVYGAGLARTESPPATAPETISPALAAATAPATTPTPRTDSATAIARAIAAASPTPAVATAPGVSVATTAYRDGTFTGSGTSRFGGFEVAVTIAGGKITAVDITRATTRYPASRVARLPGQVIERQSASVDMVSGATASSRAFRDAVAQALDQASASAARG